MSMVTGIRFGVEIQAAARAHHLDPRFLAAVAAQETGGPGSNSGNNVVGDGGHGHGVFQIDDRWHPFARTAEAMDPAKNADYAAGMLSGLLAKYGGNTRAALSAYNAGSPTATGTVTAWGDGKRLGYADSVLRHYAALGGDAAALGQEAAATLPDAAQATGALAGAAAANPGTPAPTLTPALPAAVLPSRSVMPMAGFQVTLPAPSPYPTQFRPYSSVSGMDTQQPQQIDAQMTGLVDGGDVGPSSSDGTA